YLGCNQNLALLLGFKSDKDIVGKTDYELFDSAVAGKYVADDRNVISTGERVIGEERTGVKNSKGLEVILRSEKKPFFDKSGNMVGVLGIAVDITDEVDLKGSEIDRDLILSATPGYIYWKNLDSVYIGCNQEFAQDILNDEMSSVIGKTDYTLPWGANPDIP